MKKSNGQNPAVTGRESFSIGDENESGEKTPESAPTSTDTPKARLTLEVANDPVISDPQEQDGEGDLVTTPQALWDLEGLPADGQALAACSLYTEDDKELRQ